MDRSRSSMNRYSVSDNTMNSTRKWEDNNMYKTSYFCQSERNVKYKEI
jgi:hypothetical protein